jgi:hypothetical protein
MITVSFLIARGNRDETPTAAAMPEVKAALLCYLLQS